MRLIGKLWAALDRSRLGETLEAAPSPLPRSVETLSTPRLLQPVSQGLGQAAETALEVYRAHGLPIRPGHYISSEAGEWAFVAASLTPIERWEIAVNKPEGQGWRFARLEGIGTHHSHEDVRRAAALLGDCRSLQRKLDAHSPMSVEDIEAAVRLGSEWRALQQILAQRPTGRLKLASPVKAGRKSRKPSKGQA